MNKHTKTIIFALSFIVLFLMYDNYQNTVIIESINQELDEYQIKGKSCENDYRTIAKIQEVMTR